MILGSYIQVEKAHNALDIGTGTGVLSLMVAQRHANLEVDAIEIDPINYQLAHKNFSESKFSSRLNLMNEDFFGIKTDKKYDLIFSNPPYFINSLKNISNRQSNSRHFTHDQLSEFVSKVNQLLTASGDLFLIIPSDHFNEWHAEFERNNFSLRHKISVFGKPNHLKRFILIYTKLYSKITESTLCIRDEEGRYSSSYVKLTEPFHGTALS